MKFNTKTRYGLRTMVELAMHWKGQGVFQKDISERQEISYKYLDQIIASLKSSGLIKNADGRMSGYILAKESDKISVYDIYRAFDNELKIIDSLSGEGISKRDRLSVTRDFWNRLNTLIVEYLKSTNLKELAQKQEKINEIKIESMYYI